ncbi:MAG: GNAT family N-acetyltransferase [Candidatus Muiribacteriota bacterium]
MIKFRHEVLESDIEKVYSIVKSTGFFREDEILIARELAEEAFSKGQKISGYNFIFAEIDGEVAGYTCYGEIPCTIGSYDLYWIAVDNSRRGSGIGKLLMEKTEYEIKKINGRMIYIETSNKPLYEPTKKFYLSCNYKIEVILKDFYAPQDDKIIYSKKIRNQ